MALGQLVVETQAMDGHKLGAAELMEVVTVVVMVMEFLMMMAPNIGIHCNSLGWKGKQHIRRSASAENGREYNFSGHPYWEVQGKSKARC